MALTLRITPNFEKCLNDLKKCLDIGTGSGVIRFVVEHYAVTVDDLQKNRKELAQTKQRLDYLLDICDRKTAIEAELATFLGKN